jgi:UDPglucose--hexose-1-phosphate uridylyltransferase
MHQHVENLLHFAEKSGLIQARDYHYIKNQLYHMLHLEHGYSLKPVSISHPSEALNPILDELEKLGQLDGSQITRDLFDAKIMNVMAMKPSDVEYIFFKLFMESSRKATDWFYQYMQNVNYIRMDRVQKNRSFHVQSSYGKLDITINLSKPEKDPKSIILASQQESTSYPKCLLCIENEGFTGDYTRDSRDQLRLIEVDIEKERWYFQYSPYIYYNEHAIVLSEHHRPMKIDKKTFENLFYLCRFFNDYFFGSNADLPIVGGSILSHDHYQGGRHHFPIEKAKTYRSWLHEDIQYTILKWPLSTLRMTGKVEYRLISMAMQVLNSWQNYTNESLNIRSHTDDTPHHTVTPIVRKHGGEFTIDLIFRDNQTSKRYPLGIFHPHEDKWHIKKENIGLIEAMGLGILPGRLDQEMNDVKSYLLEGQPLPERSLKHQAFADQIKSQPSWDSTNIDHIIEDAIGKVFVGVLEDCGVFKQHDQQSMDAMTSWLKDVTTS